MEEIALALGGGGIKGVAHLGVALGLKEAGYRIRAIAGTSAGAVAGSVLASGMKKEEILNLIQSVNKPNFYSRRDQDGPSLLGLSGLVKVLSPILQGKTFADLKFPFAATAVDLITKQEFILNKGPVLPAILASSSVPGVFPPVKIGNTELVDGGILDPVPVAVARWLAPRLPVVAVCLSPIPDQWMEMPEISVPFDMHIPRPILKRLANLRLSQAIRIFVDSMDITSRMTTELRLQVDKPEVTIRPNLVKFSLLETGDPDELIRIGYEAAAASVLDLENAFSWRKKFGRQFQNPQPPSKVLED